MSEKKSRSGKQKSNRNIVGFIYFFALLFFAMIGYMIYFIGWQAEDLMGNAYNPRMEVFNDRFVRGAILSADGQVLAQTAVTDTRVNQDGSVNPEGTYTETRQYPFGGVFAQAVGYSTKGKTGLEALANFYLMQSNANPVTQVVNEIMETKSLGDNVVTTLDAGLQKVAYDALGDQKGAVIAVNPTTGEVLAMASKPSFDPNTIVEDWDDIVNNQSAAAPLLNRCTQGLYAPGSTFKIVMALEYMREHPNDWQDFRFDCDGEYQDPADERYVVHCYGGETHGSEDLSSAFANSCNAAFSKIGTLTDSKKLLETVTDPLVLAQKQYLNDDQQKVIDDFVSTKELPKRVDDFFVESITALLKGFEPVVIDAETLVEKLEQLQPLSEGNFRKKLNDIVASYTKGKDESKLRIVVKRKEN